MMLDVLATCKIPLQVPVCVLGICIGCAVAAAVLGYEAGNYCLTATQLRAAALQLPTAAVGSL